PGARDDPAEPEAAGAWTEVGPGFVGTRFRPSSHGFRFANRFSLPASILSVLRRVFGSGVSAGSYGLCGGMSFLAGDHFVHGVAIPTGTSVPSTGSPLYRDLLARQIDSLKLNPSDAFSGFAGPVRKYFAWMRLPERGSGGTAQLTTTELGRTLAALSTQRLVPLGLVYVDASGNLTDNHQVLAFGYEPHSSSRVDVRIYDPNFPGDDDVVLETSRSGSETRVTQRVGGRGTTRHVRGFFVTPYAPTRP
ncbi:MAG TPA: hypothetical protein VJP77_04625, partial [Planctomycetota bacterium]|nr:hypothetical protein [Planctomycetota bacterium]